MVVMMSSTIGGTWLSASVRSPLTLYRYSQFASYSAGTVMIVGEGSP